MPKISTDAFLSFVRTIEHERQQTIRGTTFTVTVVADGLIFVPDATGVPRKHTRAFVSRVLDRYAQERSLRPSDYGDFTVNASYQLPLIARYVEEIRRRPR